MYRALLICNSVFPDDPRELAELNGPKKDGTVLRDALTDPASGMFDRDDVQVLNEANSLEAGAAIEEFYHSAEPDDTLLLYYSGHGRTRNQQLFLCMRNTAAAKLYTTALPSSILDGIISSSFAQVRIIVLDCCYGALFKGEEIVASLAGEGRYVIAATSATDTALDSRYRGEPSPFTGILADGLRTLAVDRDGDGTIDLDDLFFYLDGLSFDGLFPQRRFSGSGAVPIARRSFKPSESPLTIQTASLGVLDSLAYKPVVPSDFMDRPAPFASFSPERVGRFRVSMRQDVAEDLPEHLTAAEFLQRAGLMRHGEITYTGALLFSDSPTLTLPSAMIQCARFTGDTKIGALESKELHGPVPDLVVQARDFVAAATRLGELPTAEGAYAEAAYSYPMIALRELIANAVVHRDYTTHGACVQLHIFADRIEIISPGLWDGIESEAARTWRLSELERQSWRRNYRLARILTWSRLVEGVGAGLPRAVADCKSVGAPEPEVTTGNGLVTVTIFPRENPGLPGTDLVTRPRSEWDALRAQVSELQQLHADELVAAAKDVTPARAIELLRRAIDRNPISVQAHYELGVVLRRAADYSGAISELSMATKLKADFADGWRELGLALAKGGRLDEAGAALDRATELDPADAETWSNLGGLLRRQARSSDGGKLDWAKLREARIAYQRACEIVGNDTYPLVNVARLDLLLSAHRPSTRRAALDSLNRLSYLARFEAESAKQPGRDSEQRPWKVLDLADTLLLTGNVDEGLAQLREAIDLIAPWNRDAYLTSVIEPLQDFVDAELLDESTAAGVKQAIEICKAAIDAVRLTKQEPTKADD